MKRIQRIDNIPEQEHGLIGIGKVSYYFESTSKNKRLIITLHKIDHKIEYSGNDAIKKWNRVIDESQDETIQYVKRLSCEAVGIPITRLLQKSRKPEIVWARNMVMWYTRKYLKYTWGKSGQIVGKDHATSMHAWNEFTKEDKFLTPDQLLWRDTFIKKLKNRSLLMYQ